MKREELHDIILGVALVALGYAFYQHAKTAKTIANSDQAAINTAISSASSDGPAINVPAPIEVQGNDATGYTVDTGSTGWLDKLTLGVL